MSSPKMHVAFNEPSPVSNILNFLIKTCIIPLKINHSEKTISFKFRSKQTLIFMLYQWIVYGVTTFFMMMYMTGIKAIMKWFVTKFYNSNTIDFISMICILLMGSSVSIFCLPFTKQLTYVANELILSPNLQLPNHRKKFVHFSLFYLISLNVYLYMLVRYSKMDDDEEIEYPWLLAAGLINSTFMNIFIFISFFVILCLIGEFKRIASLPQNNIELYTNRCINLFKTLQKAFGVTFLVTFSCLSSGLSLFI